MKTRVKDIRERVAILKFEFVGYVVRQTDEI